MFGKKNRDNREKTDLFWIIRMLFMKQKFENNLINSIKKRK